MNDIKPKDIKIFLSHANEDSEAVTRVYHDLKAAGFKPWLDKMDLMPGENWKKKYKTKLKMHIL